MFDRIVNQEKIKFIWANMKNLNIHNTKMTHGSINNVSMREAYPLVTKFPLFTYDYSLMWNSIKKIICISDKIKIYILQVTLKISYHYVFIFKLKRKTMYCMKTIS